MIEKCKQLFYQQFCISFLSILLKTVDFTSHKIVSVLRRDERGYIVP